MEPEVLRAGSIKKDNIMIQDNSLIYNKKTGLFNIKDLPKTPKKHSIGGKMGYIGSINVLLDLLTKNEFKMLLSWFSDNCDGNNLLTSSFKDLTPKMHKVNRSKFKKKLIENNIIHEYRNRIMLNPYIFKPTSTKHNYAYLTQRLWTYLFENKDNVTDEIIFHEDDVFGLPPILKIK